MNTLMALDLAIAVEECRLAVSVKRQGQWAIEAERRLERRLRGVLGNAFELALAELVSREVVPSDAMGLNSIAWHIQNAGAAYEAALGRSAMEAAQRGRQNVLRAVPGREQFGEFSLHTKRLLEEYIHGASDVVISRLGRNVMANLADSHAKGLGIDEAASALRGELSMMRDWQVSTIARTEINCFQNEGAYLTCQELGAEYIQWWTAEDERVREEPEADHVILHGQIVRLGDNFSNGLKHPGDRGGEIVEWINCRCVTTAFFVPAGKRPPIGKEYFYPEELEDVQAEAAGGTGRLITDIGGIMFKKNDKGV